MATPPSTALADKEAVRIAARQLSDAELAREEKLIARSIPNMQGALSVLRREQRRRKRVAKTNNNERGNHASHE